MRALRLDAGSLAPAEVAAWSELADRAIEPNPFFRPEYVLASVVERHVPVELIVVRDDERWLACMPFRRTRRWRGIPLPSMHPWLKEYSVLSTPLVDRDAVGPAVDAFVAKVHGQRDAAMLVLDQLPSDGPVAAALATATKRQGVLPIVYREYERAAWHRPAAGSTPSTTISAHRRQRLRAKSRKLVERLGAELEVVDRADEPAAWERFLEMEHSSWKGEAGTSLAVKATDAAFFRAMCAGMSRRGALQLRSLEGGGRSVAMECSLKEGDKFLYAFKIAYDPQFQECSPGAVLQSLSLQSYAEGSLLLFDSGAGPDATYANQLWPNRRLIQTLLLPTRAPTAHLLRLALWSEATRLGQWSAATAVRGRGMIRRRRFGAAEGTAS